MDKNKETPQLMTIRQVAKTGLLSEYTLRLLHKQGKGRTKRNCQKGRYRQRQGETAQKNNERSGTVDS